MCVCVQLVYIKLTHGYSKSMRVGNLPHNTMQQLAILVLKMLAFSTRSATMAARKAEISVC